MVVKKNDFGAWVVSAIVDGYYESRQYYYYTKRQAIKLFKEEFQNKLAGDQLEVYNIGR